MQKDKQILFLTLKVFSDTGGIEKVSRIAGKVLNEMAIASGDKLLIYSMHDKPIRINENYFPPNIFKTFSSKKIHFVTQTILQGIKSNLLVLSHVNLLGLGFFIKLLSPKTKLVLFAHGIEVWEIKSFWKRYALHQCDLVLPVSNYTRDIMVKKYTLAIEKFIVVNNCLDPFIVPLISISKDEKLLTKYGLRKDEFVLLTVSRLSSKEKYKGYDKVIVCMSELIKEYPYLRYLIVGKYDDAEKVRLDKLIKDLGLENVVIFSGFVNDEELATHFNLADLYVMPSEREGFGIVFIEAMFYGKPVIAGNKDGSIDALCNGKLGILVNPDDEQEITLAIKKVIHNPLQYAPDHNLLMKIFSYQTYQKKIKETFNTLYGYTETYKEIKSEQNFSVRSSVRKITLDTIGVFDKFKNEDALKKNRIQFIYVHHIFKDEEQKFRELIEFLLKYHSFISYSEAIKKILNNNIDKPYICFSSDDGFKNNLAGAKILEEYGIKACFFICPGIIGDNNYDHIKNFSKKYLELPPVEFLNWKDIDRLLASGHEIGSHTMTHRDLTSVSYNNLCDEIQLSYKIIKEHCGTIQHFAYPYGRYFHINETVRELIFDTGYQSCTSAERGCHVQQLNASEKEKLLIRRDHILLTWNLSHIKYFLRRNSLSKSLQHNKFPFSVQ